MAAPIVCRKFCFESQLAAQAALVQRHSRDHADIVFLAEREKFVLRA